MSTTPVEVADWMKGGKTFSPQMTATLSVPPADALELVAAGLTSQGFKVKRAADDGFRATYREKLWFLELDYFRRCELRVRAAASGSGTTVSVSVEEGGEQRAGRRRGTAGLTAALQDAQRRGITVTTTPWEKPPR